MKYRIVVDSSGGVDVAPGSAWFCSTLVEARHIAQDWRQMGATVRVQQSEVIWHDLNEEGRP